MHRQSSRYSRVLLGVLAEGQLGVRQPGPVVGVGAPAVGVLEGEGEPVVDGRDADLRAAPLLPTTPCILALRSQTGTACTNPYPLCGEHIGNDILFEKKGGKHYSNLD